MKALYLFLFLLWLHWIADFVMQTHWQASNKSKSNKALALHVANYTFALALGTSFVFGEFRDAVGWAYFIALNGILHFITDYFTSRWTSRLYAKQDWHNFFVVVGMDQMIHQSTLAMTMVWLLL